MTATRIYTRCHPVRDAKARRRWATKQGNHCQACGKPSHDCDLRGLCVHHLIRFRRSDEPTNLLLLCGVCHGRIHDDQVRVNGAILASLTVEDTLALKLARSPEEFDLNRLLALWGRDSVELGPVPVPLLLEAEFRRRRPWDKSRWCKAVPVELPF